MTRGRHFNYCTYCTVVAKLLLLKNEKRLVAPIADECNFSSLFLLAVFEKEEKEGKTKEERNKKIATRAAVASQRHA